jgi:hypothetical protein
MEKSPQKNLIYRVLPQTAVANDAAQVVGWEP